MQEECSKDVLAALGCALRNAYEHVVREPLPPVITALATEVIVTSGGDER